MVPKLHTTPIPTTIKLMNIALNDRKKRSSVIADNNKDPIKNQFISSLILLPIVVLMYGSPLTCNIDPVLSSNNFNCAVISLINLVLLLLLIVSPLTEIPIK